MSASRNLFFDYASTTPCHPQAAEALQHYLGQEFANPSSGHKPGQAAARAIREARLFFARHFGVEPEQVIFTGSGTEADNLALTGALLPRVLARKEPPRLLIGALEHPAVSKPASSLRDFGVEVETMPVRHDGTVDEAALDRLLERPPTLVSFIQVSNILGVHTDVEALARHIKKSAPSTLFHTDAVQAFGKVPLPRAPSPVDLVSISAHKVQGPKGVGALIVLNRALLSKLRPQISGGDQESGLRSGSQNPGLIAAFHVAAKLSLEAQETNHRHATNLRDRLRAGLEGRGLLAAPGAPLAWNSPPTAVPHIVHLSAPGLPSGPLVRMIEENGCQVSAGSACSSQKTEPDSILQALGLPPDHCTSGLRISFAKFNTPADVDRLVSAIAEAIASVRLLSGPGEKGGKRGNR